MAHVIAVSNQKGGVGKTTSVVNLAAFSALAGFRTLVIDSDPQGNATSVLAPHHADPVSIYRGATPLQTSQPGLMIIPSGPDLIDQERALVHAPEGRFALRHLLLPLRSAFDVILIDCPPTLSLLPTNALLAADHLVVPLQSEYFALEGLTQLLRYVDELTEDVHATITLRGILLTMFDDQYPLAFQVEREIRQHFTHQAFTTVIPRDVALAAAPSHGKTILDYDPLSRGGIAYLAAAQELLHGFKR
jgi:chromosome partitioning protein